MGKNKDKSKAGQPEVPVPFQRAGTERKQHSGQENKGNRMRPEVVIPVGIAGHGAEKEINIREIGEDNGEYPQSYSGMFQPAPSERRGGQRVSDG